MLAADALEGSIFRMLRQGQRVVFDLDADGRATSVRDRLRTRPRPADRRDLGGDASVPTRVGLSARRQYGGAAAADEADDQRAARPRRRTRRTSSAGRSRRSRRRRPRLNSAPPIRPPSTPTTIVPMQPRFQPGLAPPHQARRDRLGATRRRRSRRRSSRGCPCRTYRSLAAASGSEALSVGEPLGEHVELVVQRRAAAGRRTLRSAPR